MNSLASQSRRWGSLTDMPPSTYREATAILRRRHIGPNVTFILPYVSTESGERRVWRYGPDPNPPRRRVPLFGEPGGAA